MKILLNSFNYSGIDSGIGLINRNLMERMVKYGNEVHVIAQTTNVLTKEELPKEEIMNGVNVHRIKRSKFPLFGTIIYTYKSLKLTKKIKPDIIHEMGLCGFGYLAKKLLKIPYCVMGQGVDIYKTSKIFDIIIGKKDLENADKILAPIIHLKEFIKNKFNIDNVEIVRSGVDFSEFNIEKEINNNDTFKLIAVGRLIPAKRFDLTIKAVSELKEEIKNITFTIIGSGVEEENLRKLAKELNVENKIIFKGQIPHKEVAKNLINSDIFVYPTEHPETCSLALLEANAAALPIITTDLQGNKELVNENENGFFVKEDSIEELKKYILELYHNSELRENFSKNSKINSKKFDWDEISLHLNNIYKGILMKK